jgi:hypothetical protein
MPRVIAAVLITYLGLAAQTAKASPVPHPSEKEVLLAKGFSDKNFSVSFLNDIGYRCMFTSETYTYHNTSYGNNRSCHGNAEWAKKVGVNTPGIKQCYANLKANSSLQDFQYALFSFDNARSTLTAAQQNCTGWGCPVPCKMVQKAIDEFGAGSMEKFIVWKYVAPPKEVEQPTATTTAEPDVPFNWAPYAVGLGIVLLIGAAVCCYMSQKKAAPKKRAIKQVKQEPLVEPPQPVPAAAHVIRTTAVPVSTAVPVQYAAPATTSVSYAAPIYAAPAMSYAAPASVSYAAPGSVSYAAPATVSYPAGALQSTLE